MMTFFQCGGHSLLALRVIADLSSEFLRSPVGSPLFPFSLRQPAWAVWLKPCPKNHCPPAVPKGTNNHSAPLTFAQQRLWFFASITPTTDPLPHASGLAFERGAGLVAHGIGLGPIGPGTAKLENPYCPPCRATQTGFMCSGVIPFGSRFNSGRCP